MKCVYLFVLCCALCLHLSAVPAYRVRTSVKLVDGSVVYATFWGDEHLSFYVTDNGLVIQQTDQGLELTGCSVEEYVSRLHTEKRAAPRRVGTASSATLRQHGVQYIPVLLVAFADKDFSVATSDAAVNDYYRLFCNGKMDGSYYTETGNTGSVREYFTDQSDQQFLPVFVPVGPVRLDSVAAYYGKDKGTSMDINFSIFRSEAIRKASAIMEDGWTQFDNNKDGIIDIVFFIYAGNGQNTSRETDDIWPKEFSNITIIDDMKFGVNAATSEARMGYVDEELMSIPDGVGTFCHELSHALGLPDFYDTRSVAYGMDYWSIMDYGNYVNNGFSPAAYTAYERDFMGWRSLIPLTSPCTLRILPFTSGGYGYKVSNPANPDEYYVLENRQATGWDNKLCRRGHGLQVTHVDYRLSSWITNTVNTNASHQRMTLIPANNELVGSNNFNGDIQAWTNNMKGNLYPGTSENHELSNSSVPAASVFTGTFMNQPICDIQEHDDGSITLKYCPVGTLAAPANAQMQSVHWEEAGIVWETVEHAQAYNVRLYNGNHLVFQQDSIATTYFDFSGLVSETAYRIEIQSIADTYLNSPWTQVLLFQTLPDGISSPAEDSEQVRIYTLDGQFVTHCTMDHLYRSGLRSGIYVVWQQGSPARKMIIK